MEKKKKGIRPRVSIINEDTEPILRIDKKYFCLLLKDAIVYLTLGFLAGIFAGLVAQLVLPPLGVVGVVLLCCIIAILLGFKSEKQIKPFFICFKENSYKAWSKGEAKAKKGQTRNIHIQFSEYGSNENTKTAIIKRNGSGEHIYEGNYFIIQDVTLIRKYFKKHKVRIIN